MKKYLWLLLAIVLVVLQKANAQTPVAYYPLNGNANDVSGNNLNGTINGTISPTTDRFGNANSAMSFPGSISSFIQIADNALLRPANITISCWVNVTGGASLNTFVHKALSPCVNDSWYAGTESGNFRTYVSNTITCGDQVSLSSSQVNNVWKFITVTIDVVNDLRKLYIDGIEVASAAYTATIQYDGNPVTLGAGLENGSMSFPLTGGLDEVKIYNTALTAAQVQNEYLNTNNYSSQFGNSVQMDGNSDYIDAGTNTAAAVSGALTVEAWIKPASFPLVGQIVQKGGTPGSQIDNDGYQLRINNGGTPNIGFVIANSSSLDVVGFNISTSELNIWMHVVGVYDGTTLKLYKNGILQSSKATSQILACNNNPLLIGKRQDGFHFNGIMDEVRIWNTARTQAQIVANMNSQLTGNEAGLVAYYDMNRNGQGAGLTVDNKCNATGTALNGTTIGTASTPIFAPGITQQKPGSGNAISFDGVDDVIDIPSSTANNFTLNQNFTIECWAKISSSIQPNEATESANSLIEKWNGATGGYPYVIRYRNNNPANVVSVRNKIEVARWNGTNYVPFHSSVSVNDDKFHHISATKNGSVLSLYFDGVLQSTATDLSSGQTDNPDPLHIGGRTAANPLPLNGIIDEVRIWNTALTQAQIRDRMCRKITSSDALYPNLVAYYNFDESTGNTAFDATANNNNGTLTNNPTRVTSGATIGNESAHDYVNSTKTISLAHSSGENLTVTSTGGNPDGIQIYRVDELPNELTGIQGLGGNNKYFGVFQINGTNPQYTAIYNYSGNSGVSPANENTLALYKRTDNASSNWTNSAATLNTSVNTLTVIGESTEYILGSSGIPLPLNLISFTGKKQINDVLLHWKTAIELNVSHFELQRSIDGFNFDAIAIMLPGLYDYSYTDVAVFATKQIVYYRLKAFDKDSRFTLSSVIRLQKSVGGNMVVYPNPTKDIITICGLQQQGTVSLYNSTGKLMNQQNVTAQSIIFDLSRYADGVYFLQYQTENGITNQKIIKQ